MNSDKITDLYSTGNISGFAYLACIERGIYTVEDAINKGVFDEPCPSWAKEIESFIDKPTRETAQIEEPLDRPRREDLWNEVKDIYTLLEKYLDGRTKAALNVLRSDYETFEEYFRELFIDGGDIWRKIMSIRSIGRQTLQRAQLFVRNIGEELVSRGITLQSLWGSNSDILGLAKELNVDLEKILRDVMQREMSSLSARSTHALLSVFHECGDSFTSFYHTLISSDFDAWKIRNVGRKSAPEISYFVIKIQTKVIDSFEALRNAKEDEHHAHVSQEHVAVPNAPFNNGSSAINEVYGRFFEAKMRDLSTRSFNAINTLYIKCGSSVSVFLDHISRPDFSITSLPAVGRKSANEIASWLNSIQHVLSPESCQIEDIEKTAKISHYANLGLKGDIAMIEELSAALGHFALFAAIDQDIEQLNDRERSIIKSHLRIFNDQELKDRKLNAKILGITPERLRQIRKAQLKKLSQYIQWLEQFKDVNSGYKYNRDNISNINSEENTSFNVNFIYWALSIVWPEEYQLYGEIETAFENPYGYEQNLALIPTHLTTVFDFERLIHHFDELKEGKRADDLTLPVRETVMPFFRERIYYELLAEVEKECCLLATRVFGFDIRNDSIVIEKNAIRNNTEWVELIIRDFGRPMTIDEIYEELEKRHPGKSKSPTALTGAVRTNPNIVPIGRSSTYGLKEWTRGEHRGGTVREFAAEYLLSLPKPIARIEDIGKYVRQYRPYSSDKSIHSNLMMEANGAFSLFYDEEDNRYIGLSNYDYNGEYRKFDPVHDARRDFMTSCTLIEQFVAENGRFPFHNVDDEEEMRLCRFWNVQLTRLQKGQLSNEEAEIISSISERLSKFKVNKNDFRWLNNYNLVKEKLTEGCDVTALPYELKQWLILQRRAYENERMPEERVSKYRELIEFARKYAKRV